MLLWFASNVAISIHNIVKYEPTIFKALSPHYIIRFFSRNGAEAMFADLGHFNKRAIQLAISSFVYPALILTYAGEAAYLIKRPDQISTAFYSSIPHPVYWPMFVISTLVAIVASQSMISASFSIVKQSVALGFEEGVEIGNAFGVVVVWVMLITTCLITLVMLKSTYEAERKMSLDELNQMLSSGTVYRTPGICFFCTDLVNGIPPIIRHYIQHTNSVREIMVIVTVRTLPIKTVLPEERLVVGKLGLDGVYRCLVQFGYKDSPNMERDDYVASVVAKLREHVESTEEAQNLDAAMEKGVVFVMGAQDASQSKQEQRMARPLHNKLLLQVLYAQGVYRCLVEFDYKVSPNMETVHQEYGLMQTVLLAYQSLGVVYGDLGTSPVNVFSPVGYSDLSEEDLVGMLSLIFWTITTLVLIKYVFIVLHADDHGEGGTFALYSYLCRHINIQSKLVSIQNTRLESEENMTFYTRGSALQSKTKNFIEKSSKAQIVITFVVLLGTCMVIGDGALTPATCVLSALQGIQSLSPKITQEHVVLMSVVLLVALFAFQQCGTNKVSISFSPIMVMWFVTNVAIGIYNIITYHPSVLKAISPHYIVKFFLRNGRIAWDLLGSVFLSITGAEAMFADLGHFNKRAIQLAFSCFVYPSLVLTYAGEIAYLINNPDKISNAYYSSLPTPVYWPMFVVSTLAAVVASQSMISACFSIVKQSLALDCFPRVNIQHTSSKHEGQVYSPEVNYILMILCLGLVVGFKGSGQLGNAYGVVVIWVMIITTCLTTLVMLVIWDTNFLLICAFFFPFVLIEGVFMSSLLKKIPQGGWAPFAISAFLLTIMLSWAYGRSKKSTYEAERKMSIGELDQMLSRGTVYRTPGICFFFTDLVNEERFKVGKLGIEGVYRCLVQYGYKDSQTMEEDDYAASVVANLLEHTETANENQNLDSAVGKGVVFVMGRTILRSNRNNNWLARFTIDYLYRFLQKNSRAAFSQLRIPPGKTMQVGMLYEI
ncbi:hypothetical protein F0562_030912 [Nyssa sinensis]|uniref:Potassium transporter n=1 Tax=Nyssa sinensis TaxID=561372 RepID=A0A5J5ATS1_9ASTE|nr:hypothetical protein F0562_030912 [Nyssa sinensis]